MNVCILSRFPPIEGGISAKSYWLARGYAEAGVSVHVVSNGNEVEKEYQIKGCYPHLHNMAGITLHEVEEGMPWHIPYDSHSLEKLLDKALTLHEEHPFDVVDTGYLIPYGIAGYLLKRIKGIPYIVRHGGSDIEKFLNAGRLEKLLEEVLNKAAVIATDPLREDVFRRYKNKREISIPYVPDPLFFNAERRVSCSTPRLLFLGKINWHWEKKGLKKIVRCLKFLPEDWEIKFIGQGKGEERFREFLRESGMDRVRLNPFVPPWQVPGIMSTTDYIFCLTADETISSFSNLLVEAACCGLTVIVDEDFDSSPYNQLIKNIEHSILRVASDNPQAMAKSIISHLEGMRINRETKVPSAHFENYIKKNIEFIEKSAQA